MPTTFGGFPDFLFSTLHVEDSIRVYHVCTEPTVVKSIFSPLPGAVDERTICESHFLAVSQKRNQNDAKAWNDANQDTTSREVLILGIEILVFDTASIKTVFVSKADSTGLVLKTSSTKSAASSIIRAVISAFIEWLVNQNLAKPTEIACQRVTDKPQSPQSTESATTRQETEIRDTSSSYTFPSRKKLVLSLFARSQNQYLFPGSIENPTKHVLDDRQLIKWWCRLLDKLVQKDWNICHTSGDGTSTSETSRASVNGSRDVPSLTAARYHTSIDNIPEAYVIVPGCDRADTIRSFFPPSFQSASSRKWQNAFPIEHLADRNLAEADTASIPARCLIPRLPDDPKARFCDDLDAAGTDDKGQWRSVKSISQFWEMMEYRQECAAGRLVGFVWIVFGLGQTQAASGQPTEQPSDQQSDGAPLQLNGYVEGTDVRLPPTASDSVLLTSEQYIELSDLLINDTDFAGFECAADSTQKWIEKVKTLSNVPLFGVAVTGKPQTSSSSTTTDTNGNLDSANRANTAATSSVPPVNTLVGVRKKKRDADAAGVTESASVTNLDGASDVIGGAEKDTGQNGTNVLGSGLVRKKPKIR